MLGLARWPSYTRRMSSTRKPKPPDRGAPDHKPSRKVALNEVLRSLQDLVQNELNVESTPDQAPPVSNPAIPPPSPAAEPAAVQPASPNAVLPDVALADETMLLESRRVSKSKSKAASSPDKTRAQQPAGGFQQELPYLDTDTATASASASETAVEAQSLAVTAEPAEAVAETSEIPALETATYAPGDEPATEQSLPEGGTDDHPTNLDLGDVSALPVADDLHAASTPIDAGNDDNRSDFSVNEDDLIEIPVLEDAVDLSEAMADEALPAAIRPTPRPAATEARRLAIQAAARLNVALRKEGKPVLASDVIARLVRELEQVLANDPSNVDNTRPKSH